MNITIRLTDKHNYTHLNPLGPNPQQGHLGELESKPTVQSLDKNRVGGRTAVKLEAVDKHIVHP